MTNKLGNRDINYKIIKFLAVLLLIIISLVPNNAKADPESPITGDDISLDYVRECESFPGLVNKIIKCITHMTSRKLIEDNLNYVHSQLLAASNALIIIFIMFFALRMAFMGLQNVKKEIMVVVLTGFSVMFFSNATNLNTILNFFVKVQSEFANAVTTAITTSSRYSLEGEDGNPEVLCYGPLEERDVAGGETKLVYDKDKAYGIWQRVDCLIGYILGAHPVVEYTWQAADGDLVDVDGENLGKARFSYHTFAGDHHPFTNMAEDPFNFLQDAAKSEYRKETFISFSTLVIAIGMLFNDGIGVIVVLTGLFLVILMIAAFGQAAFVYITSLFAVIVLMLFAPIVIPLFLFRPTKQVFDFWLQGVISYTLIPGILLAYLSFMIFVIQFVLQYKNTTTEDESMSFLDLNLGVEYKQGDKGVVTSVTFSKGNDNAVRIDDLQSVKEGLGVQTDAGELGDANTSPYAYDQDHKRKNHIEFHGSGPNMMTYLGKFTGMQSSGMTGGDLFGFNLPYFNFTTDLANAELSGGKTLGEKYQDLNINGEDANTIRKIVAESMQQLSRTGNPGDPYASIHGTKDTDKFFAAFQQNPRYLAFLKDVVQLHNREDYRKKINFMHTLLILFLIVSVTFAFMSNVMSFGYMLAGVGTLATSKAVNIYNTTYSKMYKSVNSGKQG